jgi:3-deoxy-manno-octulosonate cytidylyltransferase (CMP-KDO synthetase)
MIQQVYERARSCSMMAEVFVATDDARIVREVDRFGGRALLTKSQHPSGSDRIAEAAMIAGLRDDDLIVNIQGDQPLFEPACIEDLIKPFTGVHPEILISTLKCRIRDEREIEDPNIVKVVTDRDGFALYFSRSPIPFYRDTASEAVFFKHLGFYAYRPAFLREFALFAPSRLEQVEKLEQLRALENGYRIRVVETSYDSIEVDTPKDIKKIERILAQRISREP